MTTFRAQKMKQLHHYLVSHIKERTTNVDVWEEGAEKIARTIEEGKNRRPYKTVYEKLRNLYTSLLIIVVIWTRIYGQVTQKG